jgi:pimeloyl-ACP methyl ester carboxylesterase
MLDVTALLVALLLGIGLTPPASAQSAPSDMAPTPGSPAVVAAPDNPWLLTGSGAAGSIYIGAVPPGSSSKPVLVFVAGKGGRAQDWWETTTFHGHNDMYDYAYSYGYRTAFVSLVDANGRYWGGSMWENGQMLRNQIDTITTYFGVPWVNVVAHSKGGVDTQAAIVHYCAGPRVQKLITLGTPHWGTQIADMAYSNPLWWVGAVLGELNNASYVMQTGYMGYFRSVTDGRGENGYTQYFTSAGNDWGPSTLWWGGLFLSPWGNNDGLVTVNNARLPSWYSLHVRTSYLNHDNMRMGSRSMFLINSWVGSFWRNWGPEQGERQLDQPVTVPAPVETASATAQVASGSILRGGPLAPGATATDQITVESGTKNLTLNLISNLADLDMIWTAPNGTQHTAKATTGTGEYFSNASHYVVKVDAPQAGAWRLSVRNPTGKAAAYGVVANMASPLTVTLDRDPAPAFAPGSTLPIRLSATDANGRAISNLQVTAALRLNDGAAQTFTVPAGLDRVAASVDLPPTAGVANLTFTVSGQLSDGSAFERTLVTSVAVVGADGKLPIPTTPQSDVSATH